MLSKLEYGAFLKYAPRGTTEGSRRSRQVVLNLKSNKLVTLSGRDPIPMATYLARRMREVLTAGPLADLLNPDVTLIPVPRSSPAGRPSPWPGLAIAEALLEHGFGRQVARCLHRKTAVQKAAWARKGQRPTASTHHSSLGVDGGLLLTDPVVLVDDVVTSGAQLLGAARALLDVYSNARVAGFAAVRTMSVGEVVDMIDPVAGVISNWGGATIRTP